MLNSTRTLVRSAIVMAVAALMFMPWLGVVNLILPLTGMEPQSCLIWSLPLTVLVSLIGASMVCALAFRSKAYKDRAEY